jgi:predicted O-linked N-acetylglucosamine transferase (SPINDLY family)
MLLRLLNGLRRSRVRAGSADAALREPPAPPAADPAEACLERCRALERGGELEAALECYRACAVAHPGSVNAHLGAASVLASLWCGDECFDALSAAQALVPYAPEVFSDYLLWSHLTSHPEPAELFERHACFGAMMAARVPARYAGRHPNAPDPGRRLRVGYVSRNFLRHSVAFFAEPVIAGHDRARFEVYAYYTHSVVDETTQRIAAHVDAWRHVGEEDDETLARRIFDDGIDILVDLGGHTKRNRLGVFAAKPAPVQVTWLGYPDTTGVAGMDYRITDEITDPAPHADARHSERLLRVPPPFLCYAPPADSPPVALRGAQPVVFGSFNMLAKVNAGTIALWSCILREVPGSRIRLKSAALAHRETAERVLRAFESRGIARKRIVLRGWADDRADHLEAYGKIDIALDTFPYNGTTTTCEALWMGVPVVTLEGVAHMSRVGSTLLRAAGLPELVAPDAEVYVATAVALARDGERRRRLRAGMRARLTASPLLDAARFTGNYERALQQAWASWCAAQPSR